LTLHEYRNDDKGYSNETQKRMRVRELLDATFAAKQQAHTAFQDISSKLKKATEEKKACETRFKYLADVAKREFGVTVHNKRKFSSDSLQISSGLGTFRDFRPKKQRFDDFGKDDEEEFPAKEELPKKEEIMSEVELEDPDGQRLRRPTKILIPRNWRTPTIKQESESQNSFSPDYFPKKMELSEAPRVSPMFQPTARTQQMTRRGDECVDFRKDMSSPGTTETPRSEDEDELNRYYPETSSSRRPFQRTEVYPTPPSILHTPQAAKDSTWTGLYTDAITSHATQKDSHPPANSSRTDGDAPAMPEADGFINDLLEMWGPNVVKPDTMLSNTNGSDIPDTPTYGSDAGGFKGTSADADELKNNISDMTDSGATTPESPAYDAAEFATTIGVVDNSGSDSDAVDPEITDVDLIPLREHKPRIEFDFLNEGYDISSALNAGNQADSEDDEEKVRKPARCERLVTCWDSDGSDSSVSDSSNSTSLVPHVSGSDANDSFIASDAHGGDSDGSTGSVLSATPHRALYR
jgi:hypothetical protein